MCETLLNQTTKYSTLSDNYKLIKTSEIKTRLLDRGFVFDRFVANKVRKQSKQGFQKHRLIMDHPSLLNVGQNDGKAQLLVTNSHDGTSGIVFQLGFFRMVCSNGLVLGKSFSSISIRHTGLDIDRKIDEAIVEIAAQCERLKTSIEKMKSTKLDSAQIVSLEKKALASRLELVESDIIAVNTPINRIEDQNNDLFTVYNRIQEGIIRGGTVVLHKKDNKEALTKVRALRGIDSSTKVNKNLFDLVETLIAA